MKSLWVHGFNFPTSPAADCTLKLPSVISVPARPTVFWEILEIYDCKINIQINSPSFTLFLLLYAWMHGLRCLPILLFTPFLFFHVITHLLNINATGKKRPGCKEGHRRHGSARDQIWRHGLLHHARSNRTLAVVPGARCQIITFRTAEEEGESPLLFAVAHSTRRSNKQQLSVIQKLH